ncbi:MAG: hypothetical protein IT423_08345 [Pirellulaceae bacterium]|nr:hypothetical protein [Pirellulaceae bacterium]
MTDLDALKLEPVNSAASTGSKAAAVPSPSKPSIFDDDLPELAELEAPRPRTSMAGILGIEGLDEVELVKPKPSAAGSSASGQSSSKAVTPTKSGDGKERKAETKQDLKKAAALDPANAQYRVPCPSCGTPQYVTLAKQGKQVKCPDCFSDFKIPPPPPGWKPTQPAQAKWGTDLVEPTAVEAQRDADRSKNQADDLLRQARQELDDNDIESMYDNDFDTQSFVRRTFGFAYDGVALFQIFIYALMFGFMFFIAQYCVNKVLIDDDKGYALIGGLSVPLLAIISAFPLFAGAMTLLESVANGQFKVRDWPGFNFFDHVGELLLFGTALIASALPGFLLGGFVANSGGAGLIVVFTTMLTTFLAFPIVLLSMLDNESLFNPYSPEVLKSLSVGYEAWGTYYFKTFIANFVIFIAWAVMLGHNAILAGIGGMLLPLLIFFTVQQLGVLAFDISEHLSIIVPPKAEEEVQEA